jgi:hypothetical protein
MHYVKCANTLLASLLAQALHVSKPTYITRALLTFCCLQLFEPCQPVPGLQLTDVQLHLQPEGSLAGVASGTLASTAVSALATVNPTEATGAPGTLQAAGQDLAMVMTAETVAAGNLADVITVITGRDPPTALLQSLRQQQQQPQQQRMQFSSVTLTYQSPKTRRRRSGLGPNQDDAPDGGFHMVAVPDIEAAPSLKQMLDAIGLNRESLTLRMSSASGSAFGVRATEPYVLKLPEPFTASGPTVLNLEYGKKSAGQLLPADTLMTTSLSGSSTTGLQLPGVEQHVLVDLSSVVVTTPTAIVGVSGEDSKGSAPVTGELEGRVVSHIALDGANFLHFEAMDVSVKAGFQPLVLQDMKVSGPLTAFGVTGTAEFSSSSSSGGVVQQEGGAAAVELSTYLPSVDLPLMARSLGVNMSLGVINADMKSVRGQISPVWARKGSSSGAGARSESGPTSMAVAAELQMLGMSSYVNFDLAAQQATPISASFVAGQINKVS